MKKYNIKIQILKDKFTGRFGLGFVDKNGSGLRISKGKDTGSWNVIESLQCEFSDKDLKEYEK